MVIGVVPHEAEAELLRARGRRQHGLVDQVVIADARDPVGVSSAIASAGGPADVTVVCVDVPGCEGGAILATAQGGTVIFFSMATSFSAAALGAEGVAADVTMLVGNGYVPGHAELASGLIRTEPGVRGMFQRRIDEQGRQPTGTGSKSYADSAQPGPRGGPRGPRAGREGRAADRGDGHGPIPPCRSSGPCSGSPGCRAPTPTACRG